jgi:hypothetical protein
MDQPPLYPEQPPAEGAGPPGDPAPTAAVTTVRPLSARVAARPEPRVTTALAGAGCVLAVTGSFLISGDALDGSGGDGGSQLPGLVLSMLLLAAGLALLARGPSAALRTAGSVASVLSIPALAFFLTFDEGGFPPYSTEAILGLSAGGWLVLHAVGPAAGRSFPLAAGVIAGWLFVLQIIEEPFTSPFSIVERLFFGSFGSGFDDGSGSFSTGGFDTPDLTTMGYVTLALAGLVVWLGHRADGAGAHGRAVALAFPPILMVPIGVLLLAGDLEQAGTGIVLFALGVGLCTSGAKRNRRATAWTGAVFTYYGAGLLVDEVVGDSATASGFGALVAGAAIVGLAHALGQALDERDELDPGPIGPARPATQEV